MPGLSIHLLSHPPIHIHSSIRSFARSFVIHIHTSIHCRSYLFLPSIHPYVLTLVIPKKGSDSCVFFQKCSFFSLSLSTLPLLPSSVTNTCPHHLKRIFLLLPQEETFVSAQTRLTTPTGACERLTPLITSFTASLSQTSWSSLTLTKIHTRYSTTV